MGHEVLLVGRKLPNSVPLSKYAFRQKRLHCYFRKGKWFYLEFNLRLFLFLLSQKMDAINSVDLDTLLPGVLVSRLRGKRIIYDAHEYFSETPEVVRRPTIQKIWSALAQWCIPRVHGAYTVGPALAQILGDRYGVDFGCIRNLPFGKKRTAPPRKESPPVLLYQGALNEGRGLEAILRAMPDIPNAQLWLAGEGDLSRFLRKLAHQLSLNDRVRFLGYVRPEDLTDLTPRATIGLNLLENRGLSYYYSLANKAFDYLQAEVPAIHMDFPEYRALSEQYGGMVLLEDLSPAHLAYTLTNLLNDPQQLAQLIEDCHSAAPHLTWEQEQHRLHAFFPLPAT